MAELASQVVLHALIAALVVEAMLRLWRIRAPGLRLGFRLLALALPLLILPAFTLLAPVREAEWFRDRWALFAGARWGELELGGMGLDALGLVVAAGLGLAAFLLDVLPFLTEWLRRRVWRGRLIREPGEPVGGDLWEVARAMGLAPPPVLLVDTPAPLLLCAGIWRPRLVVSRGVLERLDGPERRAAFAHELGHLGRRDPLLGWILMAARALMFFNPVVHVVARAAVQEIERRADDLAVSATRDPAALASALLRLYRAGAAPRAPRRIRWGPVLHVHSARARAAAVEARCRRLLDPIPPPPVTFGRLRVGLTGLGLSLLLFFVV